MSWELSDFGRRLAAGSGIGELMQDLGHALAEGGEKVRMLGGGQPAHIPAINQVWRSRLEEIAAEPGRLEQILGNYEPPAGNQAFRKALAKLFQREFSWEVTADNIAVTAGGQTALFLLFNSLAGRHESGREAKVLLPLVPEYIGYAEQSVGSDIFVANKPLIEQVDEHEFKYRVDFDGLTVGDDVAAICVSRPTNPSGNVLTDAEIRRLASLAAARDIPLIIDNAYGAPFPNAIFTETTPVWNDGIILTMSLSKLGLPGTRTGIVVAREEIVRAIASMTSIIGLANTNLGQAITLPLVESGEILKLSNEIVQPFYRTRAEKARQWACEAFDPSLPYRIHRSEGAFFLWLWLDQLPITSRELYQRLKARDVLVVPGNYFFFGHCDPDWRHQNECLRISFTMPDEVVRDGLKIIAEEVARAYSGN